MIEYLFIATVVLAVTHFVYESCVLPELRIQYAYRLFRLRDELRREKLDGEIVDIKAYGVLQQSLNNGINFVSWADFRLISEVRHAIDENKHLAKQTEERVRTMDSSTDPVIQRVRSSSRKTCSYALVAGMGTWFLYLLPIAVALVWCDKIKDIVKKTLAMPSGNLDSAAAERQVGEGPFALA